MTYNKVWRTTYTFAFIVLAYAALCSFMVFPGIELGHPFHFELHMPSMDEYARATERACKNHEKDYDHLAEWLELQQAERECREMEPRQGND